jgi:hypothetical protein
MDERKRELIDKAWVKWREAERAYREESARYVSFTFGDEPLEMPEKVVTHEALALLSRLRAAAAEAQERYTQAAAEATPG